MKDNKFIEFFSRPRKWFSIVWTAVTIPVIAATLVLLCLGYTDNVMGYVMYALSAIGLGYFAYLCIYWFKPIKQWTVSKLSEYRFTKSLISDFGFRTVIMAAVSFFINIAYAVFQGVMAIIARSPWLGSLSAYYLIVSIMRGVLVLKSRKKGEQSSAVGIRSYRDSGIALLTLNIAIVGFIVLVVRTGAGFEYAGLMIYAMAAYAFYKLTMGIINLVKARRENDMAVQAIKNIGFADALVSIFALQTALIAAFSDTDATLANALTGTAVSVMIVSIGIAMIIKGSIGLKKIQEKNND